MAWKLLHAYWRPKDGGFDHTDPHVLVAKLFKALKSGGVVVVQDHVAAAGGDPKQTAELHRIDPAAARLPDLDHDQE